MKNQIRIFRLKDFQKTELPLAVWKTTLNDRHDTRHRHDCYEMIFLSSGAGWSAINDRHFPMVKGDLFLMTPDDFHEAMLDNSTFFYNILFSEDLLRSCGTELYESVQRLFSGSRKLTFPPTISLELENLLRKTAYELAMKKEHGAEYAKALFTCFLIEIVRFHETGLRTGKRSDDLQFSRVLQYINEHNTEKIPLEKLARITGNTPAYFGRLFKHLTGIPVSEYIMRSRIENARCELERSGRSISEIASTLGFYDSAYFTRMFSRIVGMTPSAYRKLSKIR